MLFSRGRAGIALYRGNDIRLGLQIDLAGIEDMVAVAFADVSGVMLDTFRLPVGHV